MLHARPSNSVAALRHSDLWYVEPGLPVTCFCPHRSRRPPHFVICCLPVCLRVCVCFFPQLPPHLVRHLWMPVMLLNPAILHQKERRVHGTGKGQFSSCVIVVDAWTAFLPGCCLRISHSSPLVRTLQNCPRLCAAISGMDERVESFSSLLNAPDKCLLCWEKKMKEKNGTRIEWEREKGYGFRIRDETMVSHFRTFAACQPKWQPLPKRAT